MDYVRICCLYFVSPREQLWHQLVIACPTCVCSLVFKKEHRDWHIKDDYCSVYPWDPLSDVTVLGMRTSIATIIWWNNLLSSPTIPARTVHVVCPLSGMLLRVKFRWTRAPRTTCDDREIINQIIASIIVCLIFWNKVNKGNKINPVNFNSFKQNTFKYYHSPLPIHRRKCIAFPVFIFW